MEREIKHYQGEKIDIKIYSRLFAISAARNFLVEGLMPYSEIDTTEDLENFYDCDIDDFHVILGQDWYITYLEFHNKIEIVEWCALDNKKEKCRQVLEMMRSMIAIFLLAKDKDIDTVMRHSTSYRFYELLKNHGYIEEKYDNPGLDSLIQSDIFTKLDILIEQNVNIRGYLENNKRPKEYDEYFYHDVTFSLTKKFYDKYSSPSIKK